MRDPAKKWRVLAVVCAAAAGLIAGIQHSLAYPLAMAAFAIAVWAGVIKAVDVQFEEDMRRDLEMLARMRRGART